MINSSIQYGSKKIEYSVRFSSRKSLGITVTPDMYVYVIAPNGATLARISEIVRKRAPWILKQQIYFLAFYPKQPPRRYISGETHLYLGRQYRLKVRKGRKESVRMFGRYIEVTAFDKARVKPLVKAWYLRQARLKLDLYAEECAERFRKYNVKPAATCIQVMSKRWGSCTPHGKIILNPELIKAPRGCIEYVIVHELCHLVHRNHNKKFIDLQTRELSGWEKWKARLETIMA
jgi:predicted metal-dependent hydrolase